MREDEVAGVGWDGMGSTETAITVTAAMATGTAHKGQRQWGGGCSRSKVIFTKIMYLCEMM